MKSRDENGRTNRTALLAAAALALLLATLALAVNIRTVTVRGNSHYTSQQIEELLFGGKWDRNFVYSYIQNRFRPQRQIPFVQDYKVNFLSPMEAEVIIYEKSIVGYVSYMSSYMYFDKDGMIVESSSTRLEGVPWVTGLQFGQIVLNKPLPVGDQKVFGEIMNLTQQLSVKELKVDKIRYDSQRRATLYIDQMEVELGGNANMDRKIITLKSILASNPQLKDIAGTLHLEDYSEYTSGSGFTFKRK